MAAPKGGLWGKILDVNLSTGAVKTREIDETPARLFLGGTGLATYYMYTEIPRGADPLGPENLLIFATGPLNGTQCPGSSRLSVNFKSPISGMFGNSYVGGSVGHEIKWAGWDMILVRGKAAKPVYLSVKDDKAELRPADAIWGRDTFDAEEMLKEAVGDAYAKVLVIGPAGENRVPVACIIHERFKAAGRGGGGAVMGSKNLKAVVVRGSKAVPVADKDAFKTIADEAVSLCAANDRAPGFRAYGTAMGMEQNHFYTGSLVARNYQSSWFDALTRIGGEEAARTFWQRHVACMGCQVHCMKLGVVRNSGKFEGLIAEGPEYESGVMQGSNLGVSDLSGMMHLIEKCDALGLDNIGAGNVIGFAAELVQRGLLKPEDLDGIHPKWGDYDAFSKLLDAIAHKKGKAGELLSPGVCEAAKKVGNGAEKYAVMSKKQGFAAHDPRGNNAMIYAYALGPRGGAHTDGGSAEELVGRTLISCMCLCYFVPPTWRKRVYSLPLDMLNALCGWNLTLDEAMTVGKRTLTLQRAYSRREGGISRKDDILPERMMKESLPEGPKKGAVVTAEMLKRIQDEYYALVGWDADGVPTPETLKKYGLDFALDALKK
ncbi:MAG: aldehyde ferredoxin oxidoreductase family protein [Desulfovibrionaceae bacterium]|nr:aldehyde ferredoxin oxidoreductase family protein [Desulfovibrionaceae bacterium]